METRKKYRYTSSAVNAARRAEDEKSDRKESVTRILTLLPTCHDHVGRRQPVHHEGVRRGPEEQFGHQHLLQRAPEEVVVQAGATSYISLRAP